MPLAPLVPVLRRYASGYPSPDAERIEYVPLAEALTTRYSWDAHTAGYSCPEIPCRLNKEVLSLQSVHISTFQLDIDTEDKAEVLPKLERLMSAYPGGFWYETFGGFHGIYRADVVLGDEEDAKGLEARCKATYEDLGARFGIVFDAHMSTWNQLFRLPFVVREQGAQELRTWGDPNDVSFWTYTVAVSPAIAALSVSKAQAVEVSGTLSSDDPLFTEHVRRAAEELSTFQPAISGQDGDLQLFLAAQIPVRKYQLPLDVSGRLLWEVYNPRCEPPWTDDSRIRHKVEEAAKRGKRTIGTGDWIKNLVKPPEISRKERQEGHQYTFQVGTPPSPQRVPLCLSDVVNLLLTDEDWSGVWQYDTFRERILAVNPPMKLDAESKGLTDSDSYRILNWFEAKGRKTSPIACLAACDMAAHRNEFHPVVDYLSQLPKTETRWLDDLAERLYGDCSELAQEFVKKTLVAAVRRISEPGCQVDTVLVLKGGQGIKKSTHLQDLFGKDWTNPRFPSLSNDVRACQDIQGYWAVECAELASMLRTDEKTVRDFITRPRDVFTPMYGRNGSIDIPRRCVFIGSTNDDHFLRDETGDRRYWPVEVTKKIDRQWIRDHRDEIWSEAVALSKTEYEHWFENEEPLNAIREQYRQEDPWHEAVMTACLGKMQATLAEVYQAVTGQNIGKCDPREAYRLIKTLKMLGCQSRQSRIDGVKKRYWIIPKGLGESKAPTLKSNGTPFSLLS